MPIKRTIILYLIIIHSLIGCGKKQSSEFKTFRLIDNLESGNIIQSPLREALKKNENLESFYPLKSYPLIDLGTSGNPLNLNRKLDLEGTETNVIFAPADSEYSFECEIPENSKLVFGTGLIRDKNSAQLTNGNRENRGINFQVYLEANNRRKRLFQEFVSFPPIEEDRNLDFKFHHISFPHRIKHARLILKTEGSDWGFSFWFNPVLYQEDKNDLNIIFISVDTLRADHLSCYGYERETSPNIDALAKESVLFSNVYASSPWTLPSHVSMMTALHGVNHQVYYDDDKMAPELVTLAELLRKNNFFCSAFTGGGFVSHVYGFSKGFDSYEEGSGGVHRQNSAEYLFYTASEWIERHKDKNFFLFLHTYQPHDPYACPYPYKTMFLDEDAEWGQINLREYLGGKAGIFKSLPENQRRNIIGLYDGEIRYTDEKLIGPLIAKLKQEGLYDKTLLIFTSDHGEEFYDHKGWGHGHSLYNESLKVPLIIKFPGGKHGGKLVENIVSLIDIMPTILDFTNITFNDYPLDGKSLLPIIKGKDKKDREFLADLADNLLNSHIPQKISLNRDKYKLILNKKYNPEDLAFFQYPPPEAEQVEVFDLGLDPEETVNIAHQRRKWVNEILELIKKTYEEAEKRKTGKVEIDENLREKLKALGYIN